MEEEGARCLAEAFSAESRTFSSEEIGKMILDSWTAVGVTRCAETVAKLRVPRPRKELSFRAEVGVKRRADLLIQNSGERVEQNLWTEDNRIAFSEILQNAARP